ncbi:MAG: ATP-binding protein, partial [Armatimonadota bacterium]
MAKEYSPFTPGVPVPLEFFVGRADEVRELVHSAGPAAQGRLQNVFLSGERGIGKSSLARFARHAAQGQHRVVGLHVFLAGVSTAEEAVRRTFEQLL